MNVNSERARQLMTLAARLIRENAPDAAIDYDGTTCDGLCLADDLDAEVEDSLDAGPVWAEFRLQHDYDGSRAFEESRFQWSDTGISLKAKDEADALRIATDFANGPTHGIHKRCRGHRLVEKFSTSTFRVVAPIEPAK